MRKSVLPPPRSLWNDTLRNTPSSNRIVRKLTNQMERCGDTVTIGDQHQSWVRREVGANVFYKLPHSFNGPCQPFAIPRSHTCLSDSTPTKYLTLNVSGKCITSYHGFCSGFLRSPCGVRLQQSNRAIEKSNILMQKFYPANFEACSLYD